MAPTILKRQCYNNGFSSSYNNCYYYTPWDAYGRWIVLAAILVGAFLIFLIFSCITARRRRRAGLNPYRFTGWAGGAPPGHGQAQYVGGPAQQGYYGNQPQGQQFNNPPVYSPPQYGQNQPQQGYFGGQQSGIELQQPNNSYQPQRVDQPAYGAPEGPPPGKKAGDGIIR